MTDFMTEDFLLSNETARYLYHEHAADMPIYDYHCHLPAELIAEDHNYQNLAQIWLAGDHYKWRAMRINGIDEEYITGSADDYEKFDHWARTVPACLANPLYHWTHMELQRPFGIKKLLNADTGREIYEECSQMLRTPDFSVKNLLRKFNVALVCTTEDPLDSLEHHRKLAESDFEVKVLTAWRPDKAMAVEQPREFNAWTDRLGELTDTQISTYADFLEAIRARHDHFHEHGCRISDLSMARVVFERYDKSQLNAIFDKLRQGLRLSPGETAQFRTAMTIELSTMNADRGWVQQFHIGAMRNNNSAMFDKLGPDSGFDSIADYQVVEPLAKILDALNSRGKLSKTILYNLNPKENAALATLTGCFQDGSCPGKMQLGSAWWFLDQMSGIRRHLDTLAQMHLLSTFIGMLTDSRSFLSFSRHHYFRRILCDMLGTQAQAGLIPADRQLLGQIIEDICFNNAKNYFPIELN